MHKRTERNTEQDKNPTNYFSLLVSASPDFFSFLFFFSSSFQYFLLNS